MNESTVVLEELLNQREVIAAIRADMTNQGRVLEEIKGLLREQNGRVRNMEQRLGSAVVEMEHLKDAVKLLQDEMKGYVPAMEFSFVKKVVYGLVGIILLSYMAALTSFVMGGNFGP